MAYAPNCRYAYPLVPTLPLINFGFSVDEMNLAHSTSKQVFAEGGHEGYHETQINLATFLVGEKFEH